MIKENEEQLVSLAGAIRLYPVYSRLGFHNFSAELQVRAGVLQRIERASKRLPKDFELVVIDAYRPRTLQIEIFNYYKEQPSLRHARYVADPYSEEVVPPHATGGAVDLTLSWRGAVLGLGTDFDEFSEKSAPAALEAAGPSTPRDLRRLLADALLKEGLVPLDTEWWHWSYGDQYWASVTDAPVAIYGEISN
jgi:zinc D-Ala-D-Ala dipeptidase